MGAFDVQSMSDAVLLENTAARLVRVHEDLQRLGRDGLAQAAGQLLELVTIDAASIRAAMDRANADALGDG